MLTYGQLYEGVLRKLDKFGSPDFDIPDFNVLMPQAIRNVLRPAIDEAETKQKTTDNIRYLLRRVTYSVEPAEDSTDKPLAGNAGELPDDYYMLRKRSVEIEYEMVAPYGRLKVGDTFVATATRVDGDQRASVPENYFLRATPRQPYFRVFNNNLEVFPEMLPAELKIKSIKAEYFRQLPEVKLVEAEDLAPTEESLKTQTIYPDYLDDQFIEECVRLVQRGTGDERIPVNPGANPSFLT